MRRRFLSGSATGCLLLALLVSGAVLPASRAGSPAPARAAQRSFGGGAGLASGGGGKEAFLTRFGKRYLKDVDIVAEADVDRVSRVGTAVEVAVLVPRRILFDGRPAASRRNKGLLVLCNRGEFVAGTRFLLFLKSYGSGMMYTVCERLPFLDENYREKARMIAAYIRIERIPDLDARRKALKEFLVGAVADPSEWIRWNAIYELENLVGEGKTAFDDADIERIAAAEKKKIPPSYRKRLEKVLDAVRAARKEERQGGKKGGDET